MNAPFPSRLLTRILVACWLGLIPHPSLAQAFFAEIDDLPLADGLAEQVDEGVVFESPGGRIVSAVAYGDRSPEAVARFYGTALPGLGWDRQSDGSYRREDEVLTLDISRDGARTAVRFRLVPAEPEKGR